VLKVTTHLTGVDELTDALVIECDEPDPHAGNGTHLYRVYGADGELLAQVQYQHGPRGEAFSTPGVSTLAMLSLELHHLQSFQNGPFACRENALAITALEEARNRVLQRIIDRKLRGVLGKNAK
jgi:hypothetical protein